MQTSPSVDQLDDSHVTEAAELLAGDLADTPLGQWLVPARAARTATLSILYSQEITYALQHGAVFGISWARKLAAVALWVHQRGQQPAPVFGGPSAPLQHAAGSLWPRFEQLRDARRNAVPAGPHDRLGALGVADSPDYRESGFLDVLLHDYHHRVDSCEAIGNAIHTDLLTYSTGAHWRRHRYVPHTAHFLAGLDAPVLALLRQPPGSPEPPP